MTSGRPTVDWQRPFYWWGPPWVQPHPRSLADLVSSAMLTASEAEWLRAHVHAGGSVLVASVPSGAGKSTLAHALAAELPANRQIVYIRGAYESFVWAAADLPSVTILVNEISDHLPIYAWSEVAHRCLALAAAGSQIIATAHADSADDLTALLCEPPVAATHPQVAALDTVVFLYTLPTPSGITRRVRSIERWTMDPETGQAAFKPVPI